MQDLTGCLPFSYLYCGQFLCIFLGYHPREGCQTGQACYHKNPEVLFIFDMYIFHVKM